MPGRTFTVEFKRKVVGELERKEKTIAQIGREHQLADSQVHKWRNLFGEDVGEEKVRDGKTEGKSEGITAAEVQALQGKVAELERLCGQITLENAYLKTAWRCIPGSGFAAMRYAHSAPKKRG